MSFPLPNPRADAFKKDWVTHHLDVRNLPFYWNPRSGAWEKYEPGKYTISDIGITPPAITLDQSLQETYDAVEKSWNEIKAKHPTAVLDPRAEGWRLATPSKAPSPSPTPDDRAERERKAKVELDEVDRQYRANLLNHDEWQRRRNEIRKKYGLE